MDTNVDSFLLLLRQHEKIIYKVCTHYAHDSDTRKDLYQEIVMQWWRAFPTFRAESKISTWLYRIALNTAISHLRKHHSYRQNTIFDDFKMDLPDLNDTTTHEQLSALHRAIAQLNDVDKALILLYLDEYKYEEIAQIMGLSMSNVGVKINRIKEKLKQLCQTN